jgi:isopentenyldiphosphate isomerase
MPTKELKKVDILIMHGSYAVPVHELSGTIIRRQRYYTGIYMRLPEKFFEPGFIVQWKTVSFIIKPAIEPLQGGTTEIFDVVDCSGRKTGETISRDEAHRIGVWHGAFHCLIVYERKGRGCALFQKRASSKKIAPGLYDVSVGGHYAAGEEAAAAGPREIREELGLDVLYDALVPVGRRVFVYCFTPGVKECEFQDVFLLPRHVRPEELSLQQEELDGVIEIGVEEGIELFTGKIRRLELLLHKSSGSQDKAAVAADSFVPCLDNYYLKLLLLARRYLNGEHEALFI